MIFLESDKTQEQKTKSLECSEPVEINKIWPIEQFLAFFYGFLSCSFSSIGLSSTPCHKPAGDKKKTTVAFFLIFEFIHQILDKSKQLILSSTPLSESGLHATEQFILFKHVELKKLRLYF